MSVPGSHTLDRGGWSLAYTVTGTGPETIVFTHGLGSAGSVWAEQVTLLASAYRVVTWDMRAHAASGTPAAACDVATLGEDLAAIVGATASGPAHCVGFSAGGVLAMRAAIDHPELVRSLILVGTSSECNAPARARYEAMAEVAARDGGAAVLRLVGVRAGESAPPDGVGFAHVARAIGAMHDAPLTKELADVRCPVLVLVGEKDPLGVGGSVIIQRACAASEGASARLEILPGLRHAVYREDPAGFSQLLRAFLTSLR